MEYFFISKQQAEEKLAELKKSLPPVKPGYVSSGKTSIRAILHMLLGSIIAIPAGAVVGWLLFGVKTIFTAMAMACFEDANNTRPPSTGAGAWGFGVLFALISFAVYLALLVGIGLTVSKIMLNWSVRGKNRNRSILLIFSTTAIVLALILFYLLPAKVGLPLNDMSYSGAVNWLLPIFIVIELIAILAVAFIELRDRFSISRYCENCGLFMESCKLKPADHETVKNLAARSLDAPWSSPSGRGNHEKDKPSLSFCPQCKAGYLEASVHFEYGDYSPEQGKILEVWLAVSHYLSGPEVGKLLIHRL